MHFIRDATCFRPQYAGLQSLHKEFAGDGGKLYSMMIQMVQQAATNSPSLLWRDATVLLHRHSCLPTSYTTVCKQLSVHVEMRLTHSPCCRCVFRNAKVFALLASRRMSSTKNRWWTVCFTSRWRASILSASLSLRE